MYRYKTHLIKLCNVATGSLNGLVSEWVKTDFLAHAHDLWLTLISDSYRYLTQSRLPSIKRTQKKCVPWVTFLCMCTKSQLKYLYNDHVIRLDCSLRNTEENVYDYSFFVLFCATRTFKTRVTSEQMWVCSWRKTLFMLNCLMNYNVKYRTYIALF